MSLGIKGNSQLFEVERNTENNFAKQNNTTEKKKKIKTKQQGLDYFIFIFIKVKQMLATLNSPEVSFFILERLLCDEVETLENKII